MTLARNLRVSRKTVRGIQPIWMLGSWTGELERGLRPPGRSRTGPRYRLPGQAPTWHSGWAMLHSGSMLDIESV